MSDENKEIFDDVTDAEADSVLADVLLKAKGEGDDKEDMDEDYMRRYMKRFMKKNPEYMQKMFGKKAMKPKAMPKAMKKADDFEDAYAEVETEIEGEAQIISLDGTKFFKAFKEMGDNLIEAFEDISDRLENVSEKLEYNEELQKAVGAVQLKISKAVETFGAKPKPRTSQALGAGNVNMAALNKAGIQTQTQEGLVQDEQQVALLQKAMTMDQSKISRTLQKAAIKDNTVIDNEAAKVLSRFESGGLLRLGKEDLQYVIDKVVGPQNNNDQSGGVQ